MSSNSSNSNNHHQTPPHGRQSAPIQIQLSDDDLSDAGSEQSLGDWTDNPKTSPSSRGAAAFVTAVHPHAVTSVVEAEEPLMLASHHSRSSMPQYNNSQHNNSGGLMDSFNESQEIRLLAKELDIMEKSASDGLVQVLPIATVSAHSGSSGGTGTPSPKRRHSRGLRTPSSSHSHQSHRSSSNYSSEYSKDIVDDKDITKHMVERRPDEDVIVASPAQTTAVDSSDEEDEQKLSGYTVPSSPYSDSDHHVVTPIATMSASSGHTSHHSRSRSSYHDSRGSVTMNIIDMLLEEDEEGDHSDHYGKSPTTSPPPQIPPLNHNSNSDIAMAADSNNSINKDLALQELEDRAFKPVSTNKIIVQNTANGRGHPAEGAMHHPQLEDPTEDPTDRTLTAESDGSSGISSKRTVSIGEIWRTPKMRRTLLCLVCFILVLVVAVVVTTLVVLGGGDDSSNGNELTDIPSSSSDGNSIAPNPTTQDDTTSTSTPPSTTVPTVSPTEAAPTPAPLATFSPAPGESGVNYRATYQARFQHLLDYNCEAPDPPLVRLFCRGTITLVSTSDARITCSDFSQTSGWNGLECTATCATDEECMQVYLERVAIQASIFGQVEFTCDGRDVGDVDSYLHFVGGPDGVCQQAPTGGQNGRNFHVAQLGVQCPTNSQTTRFDYDDYFFEGGLEGFNFVGQFDNRYTVYDGTNCEGSACTVRYDDVFIQAESHNFYHCIQPVGSGVTLPPAQTMEELRRPSEEGFTYSVQFQANWRALIDSNYCSRTTDSNAPVRITCIDDAKIALVETIRPSVNCAQEGDSVLECTDSMGGTVYTGVIYTCTGSSLPETHVEYLPQEVSCASQTSPEVLRHNLQMGVHCNDVNGPLVVRFDYIFECGRTDDFTTLDGADNFTCLSTAEVPARSTDAVTIPSTQMYTNYQWSRAASSTFSGCVTQTAAP